MLRKTLWTPPFSFKMFRKQHTSASMLERTCMCTQCTSMISLEEIIQTCCSEVSKTCLEAFSQSIRSTNKSWSIVSSIKLRKWILLSEESLECSLILNQSWLRALELKESLLKARTSRLMSESGDHLQGSSKKILMRKKKSLRRRKSKNHLSMILMTLMKNLLILTLLSLIGLLGFLRRYRA